MKEIKKIYLMHILAGFSTAASVTFTLYFLSHGLTQAQIGQLFAIFMISLAIFDIPTGGIADMFGHKASVSVGLFFQSMSFLLFFLYPSYIGFLIGMLSSAIGLAFQSGATSSLIYELLRKEKVHKDFQKILGRASGYFLLASVFAAPIGTMLYKYQPRLPYFIAFIVFFLASVTIYFVKWEFKKKPPTFSYYFKVIGDGVRLTVTNRILMGIVIIGIALSTNRLVFNQNISQPYIVSTGVDVAHIGIIASLVSLVGAFISVHAYKISKTIGRKFSLFLIVALPGFAVIALSFINTLFAIPIILILFSGHAFRDPVFAHISQEEIASDKRGTMASTTSFLVSICVGLLLPFWGSGIDSLGIHTTLFLLGLFSLIVGSAGLLFFRRGK